MNNQNDRDLYTIPPNFIGSSTFLGGMFKVRNVIEAGILAVAIGAPVMFLLPYSLMTRIIILCLTALPAAMIGLMGISGESLSSFIVIFFRYLKNRHTLGSETAKSRKRTKRQKVPGKEKRKKKPKKKTSKAKRKPGKYERPTPEKTQKQESSKKQQKQEKPEPLIFLNPVAEYFPIEKIENGIIYTKDRRFVKIVEVIPINFLLRSTREQRNIIYSFVSYLKISPIRVQFKVLTRRADINLHMETVRQEMEVETNEQCRLMQEDYLQFVQQISSREAVTRRFFLIFEHEPWSNSRKDEESDAITSLQTAVHTASNYLRQCGNKVIAPDNEDEFTVDVLYNLLCRNESAVTPLPSKVKEVAAQRFLANMDFEEIPAADFFSPKEIDFTHGRYIRIDGLYYAYLLVPSDGYRSQVPAGWLSLIVNAGDGVDMDMFLSRQSKERIVQTVGQQLRINRSKIKDASDTNTDFDDIDSAIKAGYYLKEGLANNEDFYYMNLLITITAPDLDELEWKVSEMRKLLVSQDMQVHACNFQQEQAFLSSLPLVSMEKKLYERSKRNLLTSGAASCYPFTSYEMCDNNGILLGVNKYNSSLIIVDIFNSTVYKNANIAILGTSGAGKTFTMQLMALRMRRKGIPIERFKKQYENMLIDLVLLSEKVACKLRSLIYASGNVPKPEYLKRASYEHGIEISYEGAVLSITLPRLLPKRGGKYSSLFLMDPLHQALEEFTEKFEFPKFEECTVSIVHLYDATVLDKPVFDFDNLQQKQLLDTIATHVMIDDAAPLCNVYCTTRRSKENLTRVFIMQKDRLGEWLQKTENGEN